jgi:hypothetical protein
MFAPLEGLFHMVGALVIGLFLVSVLSVLGRQARSRASTR